MIAVVFLTTSQPFRLLLQGRDDFQEAPDIHSQREFLKDLDAVMTSGKVSDTILKQYLFFVAHNITKNRDLIPHD